MVIPRVEASRPAPAREYEFSNPRIWGCQRSARKNSHLWQRWAEYLWIRFWGIDSPLLPRLLLAGSLLTFAKKKSRFSYRCVLRRSNLASIMSLLNAPASLSASSACYVRMVTP